MYPVLLVPDVGFKFYFFLMILPERSVKYGICWLKLISDEGSSRERERNGYQG
jgi:hypothetical protein